MSTAVAPVRGVSPASPRATRIQRWTMLGATVIPFLGLVAAIVWMWGWGVSGVDLGLLLGFYTVTGLGITVGFHRLLTHQSFKAPGPVRAFWAIAGSFALQGSVIDWVATHRRHHAYSDELGDPHSPHVAPDGSIRGLFRGLFDAHLGWLFRGEITDAKVWAPDLLRENRMVRINAAFPAIVVGTFVLPALLGGLLTWSLTGAVSGFLWGGLVRVFLLHHVTWSINSICHVYGTRPFEARDESRNNFVMALLAFGEGWHNGHHAFPASARHGLRWWEFDTAWITIRLMEVLRLARDVKVPSPAQMTRKLRAGAG